MYIFMKATAKTKQTQYMTKITSYEIRLNF